MEISEVRMNAPMEAILGQSFASLEDLRRPLPDSAQIDYVEGYKEVSGCVVPAGFDEHTIDLSGTDETSVECLLSKVHIGEFVDEDNTAFRDLILLGISYALDVKEALEKSSVKGPFRLIVDANSESEPSPTCAVRFHRLRRDQLPWLDEDLRRYKNPILTLDVKRNPS